VVKKLEGKWYHCIQKVINLWIFGIWTLVLCNCEKKNLVVSDQACQELVYHSILHLILVEHPLLSF